MQRSYCWFGDLSIVVDEHDGNAPDGSSSLSLLSGFEAPFADEDSRAVKIAFDLFGDALQCFIVLQTSRRETLGLCGVTLHYLYAALVDEVGRLA